MTTASARPRRRGARERFTPDTTVASPCISVCWLDDKTGLCEGCKRSADEIRDWMIMSADQKRAVLADLESR